MSLNHVLKAPIKSTHKGSFFRNLFLLSLNLINPYRMKITRIFSSLVITAVILFISSCGPDPSTERPIEEVQLEKLVATWKIKEVKLDDVDKTNSYANFQLTISGTPGAGSFGYTRSALTIDSPWPKSGTWTFGANPETQVIRDSGTDKLDITYAVSSDGTQLQLNFDFSGVPYPAGRISNVIGKWVFTFTK
jgi:hypothetical protein